MTKAFSGRPTWLEIDLAAIVHNFHIARQVAAIPLFPVIKANGYGLGAIPIAHALTKAGADGFCVALVEEAKALREAGIHAPLIILSGFVPGLEEQIIALNLQPVIGDFDALQSLCSFCRQHPLEIIIHLKVDTGMGRMGFPLAKIPTVLAQVAQHRNIRLAGILSHLGCADDLTGPQTADQLALLQTLANQIDDQYGPLGYSLANSAGLLGHPATRLDWGRPGILLYGASPFFPHRTWKQDGLQPVVRWLTHILSVQEVPTGTPLGYGHDFVTSRPSRIGLLPVGYADGYSRCLKDRAQILTLGQFAPVVGRISMDLTLVDLTDIPAALSGTLVTLMGQDGEKAIDVEAVATWMETIPYEVLCRLGSRLPRHYLAYPG